ECHLKFNHFYWGRKRIQSERGNRWVTWTNSLRPVQSHIGTGLFRQRYASNDAGRQTTAKANEFMIRRPMMTLESSSSKPNGCPLSAQSGHWPDKCGMSAFDPKRTW